MRVEGNAYILDANYTATFYDNDDESKLAYFNEDIGLNCFYFLQKLKKAPWFNTPPDSNIGYGEHLYHIMKQLTTRYDLERYSNGLPEVEIINWETFAVTPYDPMLVYSKGIDFVLRTTLRELPGNADLELLQSIESNVDTVVCHMMGTGYNKTQILNHLMEILVTGVKSYETVARRLIGKNLSENGQPTVLAHYMTSLRDPMFWRLNKKIVHIIDAALKKIPSYTKGELLFPGIEILNIEVKKVITLFDYFQFDVTDALKSATGNTTFQVKIGEPRLNHKPFALKLNISSLVSQKGLVKIYLGPKVAPGEHSLKKNLYMLLDSFEFNFKMGYNVISRTSNEIINLSEDFVLLRTLRKKVEEAEFGLDVLPFKSVETVSGFPTRLILPKGTPEGLPLQIFAFVAPFVKATVRSMYVLSSPEFNSEILSLGYPLDLDIEGTQLFELPNAFIKDIMITHKGDTKVTNYGEAGATKKWQGGSFYDPSTRPDYSAKRKEPFDYNSKKGQYGKQEDYSAKRGGQYRDNLDNIVDGSDNTEDFKNIDEEKSIEKVEVDKDIEENKSADMLEVRPASITLDDVKGIKKLQSSFYNPSSRPDYSSKRKETFDYKSKRGPYGQKEDYSAKRMNYNEDDKDMVDKSDNIENIDGNILMENMEENKHSGEVKSVDVIQELPTSVPANDINIRENEPKQIPLLWQIGPSKRMPTVFDYLFPQYNNDDYTDERIYE